MTDNGLNQKLALVTGASRGIGAAVADALAACGARVVGTATTALGAKAITERGNGLTGIELRLEQRAELEQFAKHFVSDYGTPYILVNNAGINRDNLFARMSVDQWDQVLAVNLSAAWYLTRLLLRPMLKARCGRIVNISSVVATTGNNAQSNYVAAKAGLEGLTRALALELAPRQITVNAIAPGFIETDMTVELPEAVRQTLLERIPLKRFGTAADVADAVCYISGRGGDYITGHTLHVNGGMAMK